MNRQLPLLVPTMSEALTQLRALPDDLRVIQNHTGLGLTALGRSLGVTKQQVWEWKHRISAPREPLITLCIMSWAKRLRAQDEGESTLVRTKPNITYL